jgi:hypothetical protein
MDVVMAVAGDLKFLDVFVKTRLVQSQKYKEILTRLRVYFDTIAHDFFYFQ